MAEVSHEDIEVKVTPFERLLGRICLPLVSVVPRSVRPNQITTIGGICGVMGGVFFLLGGTNPLWLLAAAAGIFIHLIFDSLDGSVARARNQKSDLGFFLDQFLDLVAFTVIVLGIGLSPYASFEIVILGAVLYPINLAVTLHWITLRKKWIFPVMGPSELLAILTALTLATFFVPDPVLSIYGHSLTLMDVGFVIGLVIGFLETTKTSVQLIMELSGAGS